MKKKYFIPAKGIKAAQPNFQFSKQIRVGKISSLLTLVFIMLFSATAWSQVEIALVNRSEKSIYTPVHIHELKIQNNTGQTQQYVLQAEATNCGKKAYSDLDFRILNQQQTETNTFSVPAGASVTFYVETKESVRTKKNTWNCLEIKALSSSGTNPLTSFVLKSFIPDSSKTE